MRVRYRARQFFSALLSRSTPQALATASQILTPGQVLLFRSLPPQDQAHALRVFGQLRTQGTSDRDLLAAALLHDVGKLRCRLTVLERVLVVVAQRLLPGAARRWGQAEEPRGWRRAFVVAAQHPRWGAEMVASAGGSKRLIELVRLHQDEPHSVSDGALSEGLHSLHTADNWN